MADEQNQAGSITSEETTSDNTETNTAVEAYEKADIFVDDNGVFKVVILDAFVVSGIQCYEIKRLDNFWCEKVEAGAFDEYLKENKLALLITTYHKLKRIAKNITLKQGEIYHKDGSEYISILTGRLYRYDEENNTTDIVMGVKDFRVDGTDYLISEVSLRANLLLNSDELKGLRDEYVNEVNNNGN
ncbi:MAG: hypothetical protein PHE67_00105 [Campylobacterales bacterium]|nr:hypothetical protein [Campylobacterales bacterium]